MKAIILVGGIGSRLGQLVEETPKPMLDVGEKPFLDYLVSYIISQGVTHVIFATHYLPERIRNHFGDIYKGAIISYSHEELLLGTGGAVKNAIQNDGADSFLVFNGDCFQEANLKEFYNKALEKKAGISLVIRKMHDTKRYGRVEISNGKIIKFNEKNISGDGLISSGIYYINKEFYLNHCPNKPSFSIEEDVFSNPKIIPMLSFDFQEGYFIDIGTSSDYIKAKKEVPVKYNQIVNITK